MSIFYGKQLRWGGLLLLLAATLNISQRILGNSHRILVSVSPHRGYGTHFVTVSVGSPPHPFRLAIAIESDHTSLPCRGCDTCRGTLFDYRVQSVNKCPQDCAYQASSCEADDDSACHITVRYSDHVDSSGYTGVEIIDAVGIYSNSFDAEQSHKEIIGFPLRFICQQESFGNVHRADGILGMSNSEMSFVNQLYRAEQIDKPIFSLCFRHFNDYVAEDSSAGHITFGHVDRNLLDSPLVWADNQAYPKSQYALHIRRIYMGRSDSSNMLTAFSRGTLSAIPIDRSNDGVDIPADYSNMDGTSGVVPIQTNEPITYLHTGVESAFKTAFKYLTQKDYTTPFFVLTKEEYIRLPTVFIQIESPQSESFVDTIVADAVTGLVGHHFDPDRPFDVIVAIPPENYIAYSDGRAFPTIYFEQDSRIASNILQNYEIVFDISRQRIGFAQRFNCPTGLSIKSTEVCTEDSRTCEDGSVVRRDPGNNCEFVVCPRSVGTENVVVSEKQIDNEVSGEQKASGINMELDGRGASKLESESTTGAFIGKTGKGSSTPQNIYDLTIMDSAGGLPLAEGSYSRIKTTRVGPAAIHAEKILKKENQKYSSHISSAEWSLLAFFLFITAFFLTVFLTQDTASGSRSNPFLSNDHESQEDDADNAIKAWGKGASFYNKNAPAKRRDSSFSVLDRPYWDLSASSGMDLSSKNKSSFSSFGKLKSFYSTSSSDSPGQKNASSRPYYQIQKSARSMMSESTRDFEFKSQFQNPNYNRREAWIKANERNYSTDQPDLSKYAKPVNADDRSIFTRSSRGTSTDRATSQSSLGSYEEDNDPSIDLQKQLTSLNETENSRDQTIFTKSSTTRSSGRSFRQTSIGLHTEGATPIRVSKMLETQKQALDLYESENSRDRTIFTRSSTTGSGRIASQILETQKTPQRHGNAKESKNSENSRDLTISTRSSTTGSSGRARDQSSPYLQRGEKIYGDVPKVSDIQKQAPQQHGNANESEKSRDRAIFTKSIATGSTHPNTFYDSKEETDDVSQTLGAPQNQSPQKDGDLHVSENSRDQSIITQSSTTGSILSAYTHILKEEIHGRDHDDVSRSSDNP